MPIGDLFAKLGSGEKLTPGEVEQLRLEMNRQQNTIAKVDSWGDPSGNLDSNLFSQHAPSAGFSTLPHECASLYAGTITTVVASASAADTAITFDTNGATWSKGIALHETSTGGQYDGFSVQGINRETVVLLEASVWWPFNSSGWRAIGFYIDDGSYTWSMLPTVATDMQGYGPIQHVSHVRLVKSTQNLYKLVVRQNSGGNLTVPAAGALFTIARLR